MVLVLYGAEYWREIVNFDALVKHGMISPEDVNLFSVADDPASALKILQDGLAPIREEDEETPSIAKSRI